MLALIKTCWHFTLAYASALWYGFPTRKLFVIGITGTKGKSSTVEMVNAILEREGYRTAVASTIHFKVDKEIKPNLFKMTMPGRGYLQKFFRDALTAGCTHAVLEITSEGARQFRNRGIFLDALIFTNIAPEHIESHGSYENYKQSKLSIGMGLQRSPKRPRIMIANPEDELGKEFLRLKVERALPYCLQDAEPYALLPGKISMTFSGVTFPMAFPGTFTILNALAAATLGKEIGISAQTTARALSSLNLIRGRAERIEEGQNFTVIVDYAHTPGSLSALYDAFPEERKICVLGNTGGGRDTWKRPEMGRIADAVCDVVILTDEDPYDEDPRAIVEAMAEGMKKIKPIIEMDRKAAIAHAVSLAHPGDVVLITGKGTDPFIMGAKGHRLPWSDANVAREALASLKRAF